MYPLSLTIEIEGRHSRHSRGGTTKLKVRAGKMTEIEEVDEEEGPFWED